MVIKNNPPSLDGVDKASVPEKDTVGQEVIYIVKICYLSFEDWVGRCMGDETPCSSHSPLDQKESLPNELTKKAKELLRQAQRNSITWKQSTGKMNEMLPKDKKIPWDIDGITNIPSLMVIVNQTLLEGKGSLKNALKQLERVLIILSDNEESIIKILNSRIKTCNANKEKKGFELNLLGRVTSFKKNTEELVTYMAGSI